MAGLELVIAAGATHGDNAVFATEVAGAASYLGAVTVAASQGFNDGTSGQGAPAAGTEINVKLAAAQIIYGLIEVTAAYVPTALETFDVSLELEQN
jgi:hypothetical protein